MSFVRDTALSAASSVVTTGGRLVVTILLARGLAPDAYGKFVFLQWVIELSNLLFSFGLAGSLTRFLPAIAFASEDKRAPLFRRLILLGAVSALVSTVAFGIYASIAERADLLLLTALIAWCLSGILFGFLTASLQGLFRYDAATVGNFVFVVSAALGAAVLSDSIRHAAAVMAAAYAMGGLSALAVWRLQRKEPPRPSSDALPTGRSMLVYSANTWITTVLTSLVWSRGEFAILRWRVSSHDLAIYSAALSLNGAIAQGAGLLTGALTPHLASDVGAADNARITAMLESVTQTTMMFTSGVAIGLIALGSTFIPLLLGSAYRESYDALCIVAISGMTMSLGCAYIILQITMHGRFGRNVNILSLVVLLAVSFAATPFMGMLGAALGRLLAQFIASAYILWRLSKIDYLSPVIPKLATSYVASSTIVAAFYLLAKFGQPAPLAKVLWGCAAGLLSVFTIRFVIGRRFLAMLQL